MLRAEAGDMSVDDADAIDDHDDDSLRGEEYQFTWHQFFIIAGGEYQFTWWTARTTYTPTIKAGKLYTVLSRCLCLTRNQRMRGKKGDRKVACGGLKMNAQAN
eukprot:6188873-Pleurochrysis_carterae.AAC.3